MRLKLGTRGSALALVQSEWVAGKIRESNPGVEIEIVRIVTGGDLSQATNTPLSASSEKGVFAKEIEQALLSREIDLAVHSMKDLAADLPKGLIIAAIPPREDVRDVVVGCKLGELPHGARVGTGSARRRALLAQLRPDLQLAEIRGNIDTRVAKLEHGDYDAIVLAAAGLTRLGRADVIAEYLDPFTFVPDPGQGALAIQTHSENSDAIHAVQPLNDIVAESCVRAERAFLRTLGGGCTSPIGAWARFAGPLGHQEKHKLVITGMRASDNGEITLETISGDQNAPDQLGANLADLMIAG